MRILYHADITLTDKTFFQQDDLHKGMYTLSQAKQDVHICRNVQ